MDHVSVRVCIGEYFLNPPDHVFEVELADVGPWNLDSCLSELRQLVTVDGIPMDGHDLKIDMGTTSWGFDASGAQVVLYIAQWLAEQAAAGAVGYGVGKALEAIAGSDRGRTPRVIRREEAIESAMWRITSAFQEEKAGLQVAGESELPLHAGWLVMVASASADYEVKVTGVAGNRAVLTEIKRSAH